MPVHFLQFPHLSRRIWPAGSTIRRMWRHGWSKSSPRHVRCTFWEVETRISCEFLHVNLLVFIICPISFSKFSNIELWHKNGIYIYIYTCVIKCLYAFIFLYYIHIVYKNCYIWWKPVVSFMVKKLYTVHQIALSSNSEPFVFSRLQIPSCQLQGQRCWDPLHCWWAFLRCLVAFPWQQCALADVRTTCHAQKNMQDR